MTKTTFTLTAIVLAGGQSSRMGTDKALILYQGIPLLQLVCQVAQQCANCVYVITPWPERYQDILPEGCSVIREKPLQTDTVSHGPLVGFAQGLAQVQTDWVLLLACDLPKLQVDEFLNGATKLESVPSEAIALLPHTSKGWEPLCGFYRRSCLPLLTEFINRGGRSFQSWLALHPVQELSLINTQILFNCNTLDDLTAI